MSPALKSVVVPIYEVPLDDVERGEVAAEGEIPAVIEPVVLVVDDERLVADTLAIIFTRAGFNVLTAYDAKGALEIASAIAPDILVSDVQMPGMNGVDLALTLLRTLPTCRVLLFSGHATFADLAKARLMGWDFPLLSKPVHPTVLLDEVRACLRGDGAYADGMRAPLSATKGRHNRDIQLSN
jgi:DNA-binding response OmpR family regulator